MSQKTKDFSKGLFGNPIAKLWDILYRTWVMSFGGNKREVVTATAWTGTAFAVTFITETTPTVFTISNTTGTLSALTYPAGLTLYGPITAITPSAGESVILYTI